MSRRRWGLRARTGGPPARPSAVPAPLWWLHSRLASQQRCTASPSTRPPPLRRRQMPLPSRRAASQLAWPPSWLLSVRRQPRQRWRRHLWSSRQRRRRRVCLASLPGRRAGSARRRPPHATLRTPMETRRPRASQRKPRRAAWRANRLARTARAARRDRAQAAHVAHAASCSARWRALRALGGTGIGTGIGTPGAQLAPVITTEKCIFTKERPPRHTMPHHRISTSTAPLPGSVV